MWYARHVGLGDVRRRLPVVDRLPEADDRRVWPGNDGPVPKPRLAVWELTLRCDQKCIHCGSRAGPVRPGELSTDDALALVHELRDLGVGEITLVGGEAYLRNDFILVTREIRMAGMTCSMTTGGRNLGFMFLPNYRAWVVVFSLSVCLVTWFVIEKTKLGSYLRAATENPQLVQAFGVNVPRMITLTYGFGVGLAALAGVMAAPIYSVSPLMGADLIIVVFAVVVIGGMGSILGSILTGFMLGLVEGLTKVFYPEASNTVIFIIMAIVLIIRPAGLFGTQR